MSESAAPRRCWQLIIPGRPATLNAERAGRTHWTETRKTTADVRTAAWAAAKKARIPHGLHAIEILAVPHLRDRRGQDVGACFPAVKAAIDGLVDARIVPDDTPTYVRRLTFDPPILGSVLGDALELNLVEVTP